MFKMFEKIDSTFSFFAEKYFTFGSCVQCSQRGWPSDKQIKIIRCSLFSEEVWFGNRLGEWETMGQVKIG